MKLFVIAATLTALSGGFDARAQAIQVVTETTPYVYVRDGKVVGPATRVVEATLREAGLADFRINLYPWARAYDMAQRDPNVLIYLIARTPPREGQFKWVGEIMKIEYHFYKLKERKDIAVGSLQDAKNYTVGVMRNDVRHQYLQTQGFTKLVLSPDNLDNFKKLLNQQVHLMAMSDNQATLLCGEANFDCSGLEKMTALSELSTGLYMAFSNATSDAVVERARGAFQKLRSDGGVEKLMAGKP